MPQPLPDGLYDQLLTDDLVAELGQRFDHDHYTLKDLDAGNGADRLAAALAEQLANVAGRVLTGRPKLVLYSRIPAKAARLRAEFPAPKH
jgi:hypothetical protein